MRILPSHAVGPGPGAAAGWLTVPPEMQKPMHTPDSQSPAASQNEAGGLPADAMRARPDGCRCELKQEAEPGARVASDDAAARSGEGGLCRPRKWQRCRLCGQVIEIGEPCHRFTGVEPGEGWWTMHIHPECYAVTIKEKWDTDDWELCEPGDFDRPTTGGAGAEPVRETVATERAATATTDPQRFGPLLSEPPAAIDEALRPAVEGGSNVR